MKLYVHSLVDKLKWFTHISPLPVFNALHCSPLQLSVNPVHMNVGSDNYAITFAIDKRFVQPDTVRWCLARNTAIDICGKPRSSSFSLHTLLISFGTMQFVTRQVSLLGTVTSACTTCISIKTPIETLIKNYVNFFVKFVKSIEFTDLKWWYDMIWHDMIFI